MNPATQTGGTQTAGGQHAGAGTPTAGAGQQTGAQTAGAQTAGASSAGAQNQQGNNATPNVGAGQTVPLSVVTELREKNRILAGQMAEAQRQNAALMERLNAGTAQHPPQAGGVGGDNAIAPEDERVVNEITRRILGQLAPGFQQMQRVSAWAEGQEREQRLQRAQAVRAQIMERHEVFRHPVFGEFANLALQSKLAQYEAQRIPVNPFEVAEEVALDVQARLQAHNATVAQSLVAGSQAAAPGAGSGAAVTTGQATAPLSNPLPPPKNSFEAAQRYKAEQLRQGRAAVGQA